MVKDLKINQKNSLSGSLTGLTLKQVYANLLMSVVSGEWILLMNGPVLENRAIFILKDEYLPHSHRKQGQQDQQQKQVSYGQLAFCWCAHFLVIND